MAIYDHFAAAEHKEREESYIRLKSSISSMDKNQKLNEYYPAYRHLLEMEHKIEEQQKQLKMYHEFFQSLSMLIPRQSSIHDIIG